MGGYYLAIITPMTTNTTQEEQEQAKARQRRRYRKQAALKQYNEREHLRGEIPSRKLVTDLLTIQDMFMRGQEEVATPTGELISRELDRTRQAGLKNAADIAFRLLNKTIPDLKQVELRADVTEEALPQSIKLVVVGASDA